MVHHIAAKAALVRSGMLDKIGLGAKRLEVQLLRNFLTQPDNFDESVDMVSELGTEICAIHVPIVQEVEIDLECLKNQLSYDVFMKAGKLAQAFSALHHKPVILIMHIGWTLRQFFANPETLQATDQALLKALEAYPGIEIAIENIVPIIRKNYEHPETRNGFLFDNADYVDYFREKYNTRRVGTLLDTCHVLTTIRFFHILKEHGLTNVHYTMKDFFKRCRDTIKLVHLANVIDLGFSPLTHGVPFTFSKSDMQQLKEIIDLYEKYEYKCPVTIEVLEEDYENSQNFKLTVDCIKKIMAQKD